jgi:hypothetical protein
MASFRQWKGDLRWDFIRFPPSVSRYWEVKLRPKEANVLVCYAADGAPPALLERVFDRGGARPGRVLLFTTRLDEREPLWHDYTKSLNATFYLVLARYPMRYLAGDTDPVRLNFLSGQAAPVATLPPVLRFHSYTLWRGPDLIDTVTADASVSELRLPQAVAPGNYSVEGEGKREADAKRVVQFSVNLAPEECSLDRVPPREVEALFGQESVVPLDLRTKLGEVIRSHWSQPEELLPYLLVLLLLLLAVENLLANKFYRKEPDAQV